MFTGIVQGTGEICAVTQPAADFRSHTVIFPDALLPGLQTGASVAHNGCCLTVTRICGNRISFDLMAQTLAKTNLGSLKTGDKVNLERAAKFGDEIGGHVMSGHISAQAQIVRIDQSAHNRTLWFRLPAQLLRYILPQGFVGLDGCSLTVGSVQDGVFCVHLIPETVQRTLFGSRRAGDRVNVEIDAHTQAVVDTVERVLAARQAA